MRVWAKLLPVLGVILSANLLQAQDNGVREQLFGDVDRQFAEAKAQKSDLLAPDNFNRALDYYRKADEEFKRGKNLEKIRTNLKAATAYLQRAREARRLAEVTFASALAARNDAVSAEAPRFSREAWNAAEEQFILAARELEKGDANAAKRKSPLAEQAYRQAELEAIKANYLTPAWTLLEKADRARVDRTAPKTLARARELAKSAEDLLRQNRYDNDEARELAQKAKYEAAHALYLSQAIEKIQSSNFNLEDVFLAFERQFEHITGAFDIPASFERGIEPVVQRLVSETQSLQDQLRQAQETTRKREAEIRTLREQITSMEQRLGNLTEAERALKRRLERQRQQEEIFDAVAASFTREEGIVLRERDQVILRLYGLTFPVGLSTIDAQFFPLLSKVQEAIRRFPGASVIVEGHTDSQGSDQKNQVLSEERAAAVREYLIANTGLSSSQISSVGYGESRPVASNETREGRSKNRRIDVVIIPTWARQ